MSFSSDIKSELALLANENACCDPAQIYGMMEFGHAFSSAEVSLQTENLQVAQRYAALMESVCSGLT